MVDLKKITTDYTQNGYVQLPSPFSDHEVQNWGQEARRLWSLPEVNVSDTFRVDCRATIKGERVPERLDPVIDISPLFATLSKDQRILSIVEHLFGEQSVLFKDKLIFKPAGVNGYPLHQDFSYVDSFGFAGSQQLAVCISIDKAGDTAGPIEFFPGFHHQRWPSPSGRPGETDEQLLGATKGVVLTMEPGDMVFFHSLCPHRSAPNRSKSARRLLFFTYNTLSSGDFYKTYYRLGKP